VATSRAVEVGAAVTMVTVDVGISKDAVTDEVMISVTNVIVSNVVTRTSSSCVEEITGDVIGDDVIIGNIVDDVSKVSRSDDVIANEVDGICDVTIAVDVVLNKVTLVETISDDVILKATLAISIVITSSLSKGINTSELWPLPPDPAPCM
jgi:hypothetical protein